MSRMGRNINESYVQSYKNFLMVMLILNIIDQGADQCSWPLSYPSTYKFRQKPSGPFLEYEVNPHPYSPQTRKETRLFSCQRLKPPNPTRSTGPN